MSQLIYLLLNIVPYKMVTRAFFTSKFILILNYNHFNLIHTKQNRTMTFYFSVCVIWNQYLSSIKHINCSMLHDSYFSQEYKVYMTSVEAEGQHVKKHISRSRRYIKNILDGKYFSFWLNSVRCHSPDE